MHITFFSKKNQKLERIEIQKTEDGWHIQHDSYQGHCNKFGSPHLYRAINDNYSEYPPAFGDALEELWQAIEDSQLLEDAVQDRLNQFSNWVMYYTITRSPGLEWVLHSSQN